MTNKNRIDTETGYIYLGDVVITPDKKIDDYKEYEKAGLVRFIGEGDYNTLIVVNEDLTNSNGIDAHIVIDIIDIDEIEGVIITVTPINITTERLIASKKWLIGMMENCNIDDESEDSFSINYSWGDVSGAYGYDPHYGEKTGGNIDISYH